MTAAMKALSSRGQSRRRQGATIYDVARRAGVSTVDVSKADGDALLDRGVSLTLRCLPGDRYRLRHRRLDETHSNLVRRWRQLGGGADWPDADGWETLAATDTLDELEPERTLTTADRGLKLAFELPMPGISLIELAPA